jgi:hypothetical protein
MTNAVVQTGDGYDVAAAGNCRDAFGRIHTLSGYWSEVGDQLTKAVELYNRSITSPETARDRRVNHRFKGPKVGADDREIVPRLKQIDHANRFGPLRLSWRAF